MELEFHGIPAMYIGRFWRRTYQRWSV
jgi:hypothetical protein